MKKFKDFNKIKDSVYLSKTAVTQTTQAFSLVNWNHTNTARKEIDELATEENASIDANVMTGRP